MLCVPTAKLEIASVVLPLPFRVELPIVVEPSRKVTVPEIVPATLELTMAVKITD